MNREPEDRGWFWPLSVISICIFIIVCSFVFETYREHPPVARQKKAHHRR